MTQTINLVTFWVLLLALPVLGIWQTALLIMRGAGWKEIPYLISMVARDHGHNLNSLVYAWCGLAAHWWWNAKGGSTTFGAVTFWVLLLALIVWDVSLWRTNPDAWPVWIQRVRQPEVWMVVAVLSGRFLFPQADRMPWR
jgi:hypothetical protein